MTATTTMARRLVLALLAVAFAGQALADQPANLGELKQELVLYADGGGYAADLYNAIQPALVWLEQRVAASSEGERLALVLDIDDTSLSSLPAQRANDFGFFAGGACSVLPQGPCGWTGWVERADAPAIEPTLALYRTARDLGVAVLFITGRRENGRAATEANLVAAGFDGWDVLIMKPDAMDVPSAADYKAPARAELEAEGYVIVLNVGDQPSDLLGSAAERTVLLPNPFYRIP